MQNQYVQIVIYVILGIVIAVFAALAINTQTNNFNASSLRSGVGDIVAVCDNYKASSPKMGTYRGITTNLLGYSDIGVQADDFDYKKGAVAYVNAGDSKITVNGTTYDSISEQVDSDGSGTIDSADAVSNVASGAAVIPMNEVEGYFFRVIQGDGTNGAAQDNALVIFGTGIIGGNEAVTQAVRTGFENKLQTSDKYTVYNGASSSDGKVAIEIKPSF